MPQKFLDTIRREGRFRRIPSGREADRIDLLSNDYMGLASHSELFSKEFSELLAEGNSSFSFSSSASRLLSREQFWHLKLENLLAKEYDKPALIFNSGYHANVGALSALSNLNSTLFLSDKLIHASAIDGLRLGKSEVKRFNHNDINKVRQLLEKFSDIYERIIVVTEGIFSMDGDTAPLKELVNLKKQFPNLMIYLDEAHSFGVLGKRGLGLAEESGVIEDVDFIIGTFGKAAASTGAFITCNEIWKDFFINSSRSFIFSTALPPINCAWTILMVQKLLIMGNERQILQKKSEYFRSSLDRLLNSSNPSRSQIIPYHVGDANKAVKLAEDLRKEGFDVLPIRRPTVPPGSERLRFSLSALTPTDSLDELINILSYLRE